MAEAEDPLRMGGPVNRGPGVEFDPTKATTTMTSGAVGATGETVIPWIVTGSFDALPENVRGALVGYNPDGTARKLKDTSPNDIAAQRTTGYAIDPKSGEIILRQGEGGSARGGVAIDPTITAEQARNMGISSGMNVSYGQPASAGGTSGFFGGFPGGGTPSTGGSTIVSNPSSVTVKYGPGSAGYAERKSAYDLLYQQFASYGLGSLVEPLKGLIETGISPSEFTLRLRDTDAYKKRFAANSQRINKGLRALSEAEYIALEDQYQNVMRNYGLPASYYTRGDMGAQPGFEKFIAGDVSAAELEDRIATAQNRVINAAPEVSRALREFYPDITNGDILAYTLDPQQALTNIKRKVTAAEIGAGALQAGLATGLSRAEELQRYGVTGETARQGYQAIAGLLPRATKLADIYAKQGMGPFTQATAESEVFGTPGAAEAAAKRKKLTELETAQFSGQVGRAGSALARERAGQF
jgi:hypothetical protein